MEPQIYIAASLIVLAVICIALIVTRKTGKKKITPLAGVAFAFIIAGICFGDERLIGYSLTGFGVILAVIDMLKTRK